MKDVPGLTGLRGAFALYVLFYHFATFGYAIRLPYLGELQLAGWSGVDGFFVLSGYLLFSLYRRPSVAYFVRRVFRTFPLYYASLPLYVATGLMSATPVALVYAQEYFPSTFANVPLWTLAVEEAFYFVVFPLFLLAKPGTGKFLTVALAISAAYSLLVPWTDFWTKQLPDYLVCYGFGMYFAEHGRASMKLASVGGLVFLFSVLVYRGGADWPLQSAFFGFAYGAAIVCLQGSRALTNRVALLFGRISYGLYVLQLPLMTALGPPAGAAVAVLVAVPSYFLLERRFIDFGRSLFLPKAPTTLGEV